MSKGGEILSRPAFGENGSGWVPLGDRSGNVSLSSSLDEPDTQLSLAGGAQYSTLVSVRYSETSNKGHPPKRTCTNLSTKNKLKVFLYTHYTKSAPKEDNLSAED